MIGKLGRNFTLEQGQKAAQLCGLNFLSNVKIAAGGDLGRVRSILKLEGFVNCSDDFTDVPQVINGASDFMVEVFGEEIGPHARFAVGCSSLPAGVAVEIGGMVELEP